MGEIVRMEAWERRGWSGKRWDLGGGRCGEYAGSIGGVMGGRTVLYSGDETVHVGCDVEYQISYYAKR